MNESEMKLAESATVTDQNEWRLETIAEQIWNDMNGTVMLPAIRRVLAEVVPRYEKARIQTFVPLLIRRDVVERLRSMRVSIASQNENETEDGIETV